MCLCLGCAEGFEFSQSAEELVSQPPVTNILPTGGGGTPDAGAEPDPTAGFTGEPCEMGESSDCVCTNGGMGTKICRYDGNSPTLGSYSECTSCSAPPMPDAGSSGGDVMAGASGASTGGSGGLSGGSGVMSTGGSGGLSGGSGVMGSTTGGSGGSTPPPPPPPASSGCGGACTNTCFPVGILPCCAGTRCGCTWAPGAYCL